MPPNASTLDDSLDTVILAEVLEHLRISPMTALREIHRILKPGGHLILTTPNIARLANLAYLLLGRNIVEPFPEDDSDLEHITDKVSHIREYTMHELKQLVGRARKLQRFLSQPFHVAETFTGTPGKYCKLEDTIKGFKAVVEGEYDDLPEQAFYMVGGIDEVIEKAEKLKG